MDFGDGSYIHGLSRSLFAAWTISILLLVIGFSLLLLRFAHTYHLRVSGEVKAQWASSLSKVEKLGACLYEGKKLYHLGLNSVPEETWRSNLDEWHKSAASNVWGELGEDAYYLFYRGSDTGKKMPTHKSEILPWINDRVVALDRMIKTLKRIPAQLVAFESEEATPSITYFPDSTNQLAVEQYLEADKDSY